MNFLTGTFLLFFCITVLIYYICPTNYRYICLFLANITFYSYADIKMLLILLLAILLTYIGGIVIGKNKNWYYLFFVLNISILIFYKYTGFIVENMNRIFAALDIQLEFATQFVFAAPLGLSFYIFQSTTYLGDIKKKTIQPVKNIIKYAAFVSFFPTVVSGPIQKSRDLIPKLEENIKFKYDNALKGSILILYGFFEKIIVSNNLAIIVNTIFDNWQRYTGVYYLVAAVCFSFQIYSDFSAYSDIARGLAKILGIDIGKNFDNPYLAQSIAEFWKRWHISLNNWFIEYIYIPMGGSKKGRMRQYINVMIVFLVSGAWHGANWHYIVWGGVNGIFQIIGDIRKKLFRKKTVEDTCKYRERVLVVIRRAIVFTLITVTWVFFRVPSVHTSIYIIKNMLFFNPIQWVTPELLFLAGGRWKTILTVIILMFFILFQYIRKEERKYYTVFTQQKKIIQVLILALAVYFIFFVSIAGDASVNTQFIYFQF